MKAILSSLFNKHYKNGKIWKIASALLLCTALAFGVLFFFQKKDKGPDLSGEVKTLTVANEDLQKQLKDSQSKEKSLTQSNNNLRKQVDELKGQVSSQTSKINSLQKDNASLRKEMDSYVEDAKKWRRMKNQ